MYLLIRRIDNYTSFCEHLSMVSRLLTNLINLIKATNEGNNIPSMLQATILNVHVVTIQDILAKIPYFCGNKDDNVDC